MTDRPDLAGLLDAARMHLEANVLPVIRSDPKLYFQTLVALNVLGIAQRELAHGADMRRAEWAAFVALTGIEFPVPASDRAMDRMLADSRAALCSAIRQGEYDRPADSSRLMLYLETVVADQLAVNNPAMAERLARERASQMGAE